MDPKANDKFAEWLNMRYGSIQACKIVRGKIHRYLGMTLDFLVKGKLKIRMDDYVKNMLEDFPFKFNKDSKQETPAESLRVMKWMIDASFAVHPDFKSQTSGTLSFGGGAAQVIEHCLTDDMIADFMTKPLQGEKCGKFWDLILGPQE
ncbi:unnamed protein product [Cylindrotheca closterium]|uniref:Uncharacterized protein n=1 Tax=Cylindrotheca closterium TaxID=2856 RepID=A0AAD2CCP6_9STRA|nr:unnamed protein product [Cylindrotheca closterium]